MDDSAKRTELPVEDYRVALEESAMVAMTDAEGRITHVNDRFCEMTGYSREELVGRTHQLVNSGYHDAEFFSHLWKTIQGGDVWRGRIRNRRKDGRFYWVETTITPFFGADGEPDRYLAIRFDVTPLVTAMEELRDSRARFGALFENAGVGIALIDADDRIVEASPTLCRLLERPREEVVGAEWTNFAFSDDENRDDRLFAELLSGDRDGYDVTKRYLRPDGGFFWGRTTVSVVRSQGDAPDHILGIVRDVTEVREAEDKLRDQEALARLGEMAAVVAHEVKNPLAGILGAVKVIGTRLDEDAPEQHVIVTIAERIAALNELVEELLVFSRPQEPRLAEVEVDRVLDRVRVVMQNDAAWSHGVLEVVGEPACVTADPNLLERALLNLAINALQAMGGEGTVRMETTVHGDEVQVAILDRGPGIPAELKDKVFEPFYTTKSRGAGLGLATAKRILDAHGGSLRIHDREGGGTRVVVTLPRCR